VAGGGILNASGSLTVRDSMLAGNIATVAGGGLLNVGTATLTACTLSDNSAGNEGGGVYNSLFGTLTISDSTILGNSAVIGGDVCNLGTLHVFDCVIGDLYDA
jgi:hypothetical protein